MPHIPRRLAPTGQLGAIDAPRAAPRSTQSKPPVPYMGSGSGEVNPVSRKMRGNKMVGKLSMKDWDVDPLRVLKHLGKEMTADEHSGVVSDAG